MASSRKTSVKYRRSGEDSKSLGACVSDTAMLLAQSKHGKSKRNAREVKMNFLKVNQPVIVFFAKCK